MQIQLQSSMVNRRFPKYRINGNNLSVTQNLCWFFVEALFLNANEILEQLCAAVVNFPVQDLVTISTKQSSCSGIHHNNGKQVNELLPMSTNTQSNNCTTKYNNNCNQNPILLCSTHNWHRDRKLL